MNFPRLARVVSSFIFLTSISVAASVADESPQQRFREPPADARILKIIHGWPDADENQDALIERLSRQGFGGVVSNVSFKDYLQSEPRWKAFERAIAEARKAGWALWLYDEKGYPSANAGGLVLRDHPEWEASGLLIADARTDGQAVSLTAPPGQTFLAAAFPERDGKIDLAGKIELSESVHDGRLDWLPPAGSWRVMLVTLSRLYEGTHADSNLSDKIPYPNLLSPEPTQRFIELTHQAYADRLGPDLGRIFQATFTDEPSLMSFFLRPMPYRVLPWSPTLAAEFQKRRGYPLEPIVAELITAAGPQTGKHRYDYWLTIAELVSENYFGQIQTWCRAHKIPSGGHLLLEESLAAHVPLYGDMFRCVRRMDAPSIDCLTSLPPNVPWFSARLAASAGELEGDTLVMSETSDHEEHYRPDGDKRPRRLVTEAEIRGTCNRLMVGGVNCITSYYSFDGLDDEALRRLNAHVGRCTTMIRGGGQVADAAVVYPIESLWPRFVPSSDWTKNARDAAVVEALYRQTLDHLFKNQRDMTIIDARAIIEARAEGDTLVHGKLRWRVVVLPGVDTLPLAAWENLERFIDGGGVVVAVGTRPENSEALFPDSRVQAIASRLFGGAATEPAVVANEKGGGTVYLPNDMAALLPVVLRGVLEPDVAPSRLNSPLRLTHRAVEGHELYLVINDSDQPYTDAVRFAASGQAEVWEPTTGAISPASIDADGRISIALEPYGAVLIRFSEPRAPKRIRLTTGALPNIKVDRLRTTEPIVGHGEFVRAETEKLAVERTEDAPSWVFRATLTKAKVDTHLFASFPYTPAIDIQRADCLVIDTSTPANQATSTQLLVILRDETGAEFIAATPRSLGSPGKVRSYIPLSSFERAGWSNVGRAYPDLSRIREIRVGWGGYLGAEGETIEFRVEVPKTGVVASE